VNFKAVIGSLILFVTTAHAADGFYIAAEVNGKPVSFLFDTGSTYSWLWDKSTTRLGITNLLGGFSIYSGTTKPCTVSIGKATCRMWFGVMDLPSIVNEPEEGVLGWQTLRDNIFLLDAETGLVRPLDKLPVSVNSWVKLAMCDDSGLALVIPSQSGNACSVALDTGSEYGVLLPPDAWESWRKTKLVQSSTMEASYGPFSGITSSEELWADTMAFGVVHLTDVPVMKAGPADLAMGLTNYIGTLGMAALRRLDVIIDGPAGVAYVRPRQTPAPAYDHNRIGAVFIPRDLRSDDLIAQVAAGSPAYTAGIRDGDVVLKIDGNAVRGWRTDTNQMDTPNHDARSPVGTKIRFTLKRGSKMFETTVVCRQILGPTSSAGIRIDSRTNDLLQTSLHINPNDAGEYCLRGMAYYADTNFQGAITDFTRAIRLGDDDAEVFANRAAAYMYEHVFDKAIDDYGKAIHRDPANAQAFFYRGECYGWSGKGDLAISDVT
jgi:hypothetical protein